MGIRAEGFNEVIDFIEKQSERYVRAFVDDLNYVGNKVVAYVRNRSAADSWIDQTGNLRSSIGYVVVRNGRVIGKGGFDKVDGPKRSEAKENGSTVGESYAVRLAGQFTRGFALVIVAGMDYASYVEDMENKDVLKKGEFEAEKLITKLIKDYDRLMQSK